MFVKAETREKETRRFSLWVIKVTTFSAVEILYQGAKKKKMWEKRIWGDATERVSGKGYLIGISGVKGSPRGYVTMGGVSRP